MKTKRKENSNEISTEGTDIVARAKAVGLRKYKTKVSSDDIALATAWVSDEISVNQAAEIYKQGTSPVYCRFAVALRELHRQGRLRVEGGAK